MTLKIVFAQDYVYLYVHGADAYETKDWNDVVRYMEESLESYLQAENECRAQCEGPFDHGWFPDFVPSMSSKCSVAYCSSCHNSFFFIPIQLIV